ncbi:MAG: helix-turn-helix domain-containing protein [Patescibacteria group bacterium]
MIRNNKQAEEACRPGLKILGDFWTLYLIYTLKSGEKRFSQMERDLEGINPTTLTNRLKRLELEAIIYRTEETKAKGSVVYGLTEKGRDIIPIVKTMEKFARKYLLIEEK